MGPELLALVNPKESLSVRIEALRLVGLLEYSHLAVAVAGHLNNPSGKVRMAACTSLAWLKAEPSAVPIVERLRATKITADRACLIKALAQIPGSVSLKALTRAAGARVSDVALPAVAGLARRKEPAATDALEAAVALSETTAVKYAALRSLGAQKTPQAKKALKRLSKSPDPEVKKRARALLKK